MSDNVTALKGTKKHPASIIFQKAVTRTRDSPSPRVAAPIGASHTKQDVSFWTAGSSPKTEVPEANQATAERSDLIEKELRPLTKVQGEVYPMGTQLKDLGLKLVQGHKAGMIASIGKRSLQIHVC